jgi:hypothetical protein
MLNAEQVERFAALGFLKSDIRFPSYTVERLRYEVERLTKTLPCSHERYTLTGVCVEKFGDGEGRYSWKISNARLASADLLAIAISRSLAAEVAQLLGAPVVRILKDQVIYKPAGTGAPTGWHQDAHFWRMLSSRIQVTAWIALDDALVGSGAMCFVQRSHQMGDQSHYLRSLTSIDGLPVEHEGSRIEITVPEMRAGEVHYHHGWTWHAAYGTPGATPRRAFAVHFMDGETQCDTTWRPWSGLDPVPQPIDENSSFTQVWPWR